MKDNMITLEDFEARYQEITSARKDEESRLMRHLGFMFYHDHGVDLKNEPCMLAPEEDAFELPNKEMLRTTIQLIMSRGYSKTEISKALGVMTSENRTVNRWMSESHPDRQINKSSWLVLRALAGFPIVTMLPDRKK